MGFLAPAALLALPLAVIPFLLDWQGRRAGEPVRFSSLYLLERAQRAPRRGPPTRARWLAVLRAACILLLVLAAAQPVGPGRGGPAAHFPTHVIVALDVSASMRQLAEGRPAWLAARAAADSLLLLTGPGDRVALAAVADGLVGWWEAPAPALRGQLARLAPTGRPSDWPAALAALAGRQEAGGELYLVTDGARGARPPDGAMISWPAGHRALRVVGDGESANQGLTGAAWIAEDAVGLRGQAWGPAPTSAPVGRLMGAAVSETAAIPLDEAIAPTVWAVADTATFALATGDRYPFDDRWYVARGAAGGPYRIARWMPADEPPEPGALFWEAALAADPRAPALQRAATLAEVATGNADLAILPLRTYRADEAALLAGLAAAGTRLLFVPPCPAPACIPPGAWLPAAGLEVPAVGWRMGSPDRQTTLVAPGVPDHLLARAPVRGALAALGGALPDWTWELASGEPALWVRGAVAVWLVPLGPPVTGLATTPIFPQVAAAALAAWDPAWAPGGAGTAAGEPLPLPAAGATVRGPLGDGEAAREWRLAAGGAPPRPDLPGLYRVTASTPGAGEPLADGATTFVAVNGVPAEGDLAPIPPAAWRAAWGAPAVSPDRWPAALFPRRRGPEWGGWVLALAALGLAGEAWLRRRQQLYT
ncbi:MAG: BatA domain-containing protein [Gemmatimonadota bacterium]